MVYVPCCMGSAARGRDNCTCSPSKPRRARRTFMTTEEARPATDQELIDWKPTAQNLRAGFYPWKVACLIARIEAQVKADEPSESVR